MINLMSISYKIFNDENISELDILFCIESQDELFSTLECTISFTAHHILRKKNYYIDGKCYIRNLLTLCQHRGKGYANKLIMFLKNYCQNTRINEIRLDDCSQKFRCIDNIYIKNGFRYEHDYGPEMICLI